MTDPSDTPRELPRPAIQRRRVRLPLVWLVPIVALMVGAALIAREWFETGPEITIQFRTAEGLQAGRTEVRYKEVTVGRVTQVALSRDKQNVLATVSLDKNASPIAVSDSRFWVVRPRIGAAGVTGLGTLLSGAYIGVDAGVSETPQRRFVGLEAPPFVLRGEPGRRFVLDARQLGSLEVGSPVYYRRTRVGRVVGHALDPVQDALTVQVFVESPYEPLVTLNSRFWNAGGVDLAVDVNGLTVNTESLASVLAGGVGFGAPPGDAPADAAPEGHHFRLFRDRKEALAPPSGPAVPVRIVFDQSLRGLAVGAPVELLGLEVGNVRSITMQYDAKRNRYPIEVRAEIHPQRLGRVHEAFAKSQPNGQRVDQRFIKRLVENGLRAQARAGNLLTGQLYVALDFMPNAARTTIDETAEPLTLPSVPGALDDVQQQVADIVKRLGRVKFDEIGNELQATLKSARASSDSLQATLTSAQTTIDRLSPEAQQALAEVRRTLERAQATLANLDQNIVHTDAPLQRNANQALAELQRAARALRVLGDYLQQHPESLLRGKPADADPTRPQERAR